MRTREQTQDYYARKRADGFAGMGHGRAGTYNAGCRCSACRQDNTERKRRNDAKPVTTHGAGGYQKGCRCTVCRGWMSRQNRRTRALRAAREAGAATSTMKTFAPVGGEDPAGAKIQ